MQPYRTRKATTRGVATRLFRLGFVATVVAVSIDRLFLERGQAVTIWHHTLGATRTIHGLFRGDDGADASKGMTHALEREICHEAGYVESLNQTRKNEALRLRMRGGTNRGKLPRMKGRPPPRADAYDQIFSEVPIEIAAAEYNELITSKESDDALNVVQMPRVRWQAGMSFAELHRKYEGKAFIVEGALNEHRFVKEGKTIASLAELCRGSIIQTFLKSKGSSKWAGHVKLESIDTSEYLRDYVINGGSKTNELRYGHPFLGFTLWCPALMDHLRFPTILGQRKCSALDPSDPDDARLMPEPGAQPEVFLGPKGSGSAMHMDNFLTPFWMLLYDGVKRFRVLHREEYFGEALGPHYSNMASNMGNYIKKYNVKHNVKDDQGDVQCVKIKTNSFDIFEPNLRMFPEFANVTVHEGVLRRGDAIYLPSATLHGVQNDEASFGISSNEIMPHAFNDFLETCLLDLPTNDFNCLAYFVGVKELIPRCSDQIDALAEYAYDRSKGKDYFDRANAAFSECLLQRLGCQEGNYWEDEGFQTRDAIPFYELTGFKDAKDLCDTFSQPNSRDGMRIRDGAVGVYKRINKGEKEQGDLLKDKDPVPIVLDTVRAQCERL